MQCLHSLNIEVFVFFVPPHALLFIQALPPLQITRNDIEWVKEGSKWCCKSR